VKGLGGSINRSQFLEAVVRWAQQVYGQKCMLSSKLPEFFNNYFVQPFLDSEIQTTRRKLQQSRPVNSLLFENAVNLNKLHKEYSTQTGFTMASAEKFRADTFKSQDQKRPKHVLTPEQLRVSFAYAKMAVKDEVN